MGTKLIGLPVTAKSISAEMVSLYNLNFWMYLNSVCQPFNRNKRENSITNRSTFLVQGIYSKLDTKFQACKNVYTVHGISFLSV